MKRILLLTDFSENAFNAIAYAMHFFKDDECTFYLAHIHKVGTFTTDDLLVAGNQSIYSSIAKEPKEKLQKLVDRLQSTYKNTLHTFECVVDFDVFLDAIKQIIAHYNIDYLVMGTNGATGSKEVLFGSNTLQVIRNIRLPMLVIPENFLFQQVEQVLLPLTPDDDPPKEHTSQLLDMIATFKPALHVLRVHPDSDATDDSCKDLQSLEAPHSFHILKGIPLHYATNAFIQLNAIDLMIFFTHKESLMERFLSDTSASKITYQTRIPLVVFYLDT